MLTYPQWASEWITQLSDILFHLNSVEQWRKLKEGSVERWMLVLI